jgi:hypothetical protein
LAGNGKKKIDKNFNITVDFRFAPKAIIVLNKHFVILYKSAFEMGWGQHYCVYMRLALIFKNFLAYNENRISGIRNK